MIGFEQYAQVKDHYCICYFGHNDEYLTQLNSVKPLIEAALPGICIHIGCKDDKAHLVENPLKISEMKARKKDFAHIREMRANGRTHPIKDLLREAGVKQVPDCIK